MRVIEARIGRMRRRDLHVPLAGVNQAADVEALVGSENHRGSAERGIARLLEMIEKRRDETASPIGFYFARLWYYERLYPLIFSVSALGAATARLKHR